MNEKEISALRRRYRAEKNNIRRVYGCLVNGQREILSQFEQSLGLASEEEADQILSVLKKTLSGGLGRNLLELEFSTAQVMEGQEHLLLSRLRESELRDTDALQRLYGTIADTYDCGGSYVILLAHDRYDLFSYASDGERGESAETFSYILCGICPVKDGKPSLSFCQPAGCFRSVGADTVISAPAVGFLFPALEDGGANIYKTLFYTKDLSAGHEELVTALFQGVLPMPAAQQQQSFGALLERAMEEDCSLRIVRSVQNQVRQLLEEHKEDGTEEPLRLGKEDAGDMLRCCGVPEKRILAFEEQYEETFGKDAQLPPANLMGGKRLQVKTPEASVQIRSDRGDLVETRIIDGVRYILIRAEGDVTVNGVSVRIES